MAPKMKNPVEAAKATTKAAKFAKAARAAVPGRATKKPTTCHRTSGMVHKRTKATAPKAPYSLPVSGGAKATRLPEPSKAPPASGGVKPTVNRSILTSTICQILDEYMIDVGGTRYQAKLVGLEAVQDWYTKRVCKHHYA